MLKKVCVNILIPIMLIITLIGVSAYMIYHKTSENRQMENQISTVESKINDTKTQYVLKDPEEKLEDQKSDINYHSGTENSNRLEDIINMLSEENNVNYHTP